MSECEPRIESTYVICIPDPDPDLAGLIDEDVLSRFEGSSVYYGDIINAQLVKTLKQLLQELKGTAHE